MPHETSDFISGSDQVSPQTVQLTFITADREILIRALSAAEEAKEFAHELLAVHDETLGRTLKRHRMMAEELEKSIERAKRVECELRSAMGWTQRS
jgi:DNA-binding transcriptional regulator YdaS (Cro superfamily)